MKTTEAYTQPTAKATRLVVTFFKKNYVTLAAYHTITTYIVIHAKVAVIRASGI